MLQEGYLVLLTKTIIAKRKAIHDTSHNLNKGVPPEITSDAKT